MPQKEKAELNGWQYLFKQQKKSGKTAFYVMLFYALIFFVLCGIDFYQKKKWDGKVASYDHIRGTLTYNQRVTRGSGRSRRTVSEIKYTYLYKGQKYHGSRIAYGKDDYPRRKPGSVIDIIVDPAEPWESAAMVYYSGELAKYGTSCGLGFLAVIMLISACIPLLARKEQIPHKLIEYQNSFPPEQIEELSSRKIIFDDAAKFSLEGAVKYKYQRYVVISNGIGKIVSFIVFFIIFANVVLAVISQQVLLLIPVLPIVAVAFFIRPKKVFFDIVEKHLWSGRAFGTVKAEKYHKFSDIDFLCIRALTHSKGGLHFALFAVKKDNTAIYITQVAAAKLTKLCEITYEVAQIIGNVPVIISVC